MRGAGGQRLQPFDLEFADKAAVQPFKDLRRKYSTVQVVVGETT